VLIVIIIIPRAGVRIRKELEEKVFLGAGELRSLVPVVFFPSSSSIGVTE
jgi:hypothetical protein